MSQFNIQRILRQLAEALHYAVPSSPEKQLYDFYVLSYCNSLPSDPTQVDPAGRPKASFVARSHIKEDIDHAFSMLLPTLKKELLDATFFSICAEMRHLLDRSQDLDRHIGERHKKLLKAYAKRMAAMTTGLSKLFRRRNTPSKQGTHGGYDKSYRAALSAIKDTDLNRVDFVRAAGIAFRAGHWQSSYGGEPWGAICDGWESLNAATTLSDMAVYIDHVYDLEHNTDTVFNKVKRYSQNGSYAWIKRALDEKASVNSIAELFPKCSSYAKKIARAALKMAGKELPPSKADERGSSAGKSPTSYPEHTTRYADLAYLYAKDVLKGPFPAGEAAISASADYSYFYAKDVLKGPFPAGEAAIATSYYYSYLYAKNVLKGPFPAGEAAIATSADHAKVYAKLCRSASYPARAVKDAKSAYEYAHLVLKGPFPAGEGVMSKTGIYAYAYAHDVLKGPFPAGEAAIATSPGYALAYARNVLKGPFPAGEAAIATSYYYSYFYAKDVLKGPFPAGEAAISASADYSYFYAKNILKGPFPAGEAAIATSADYSYLYARNVLKGPFPAGEAAIAKNDDYSHSYARLCKSKVPHKAGAASHIPTVNMTVAEAVNAAFNFGLDLWHARSKGEHGFIVIRNGSVIIPLGYTGPVLGPFKISAARAFFNNSTELLLSSQMTSGYAKLYGQQWGQIAAHPAAVDYLNRVAKKRFEKPRGKKKKAKSTNGWGLLTAGNAIKALQKHGFAVCEIDYPHGPNGGTLVVAVGKGWHLPVCFNGPNAAWVFYKKGWGNSTLQAFLAYQKNLLPPLTDSDVDEWNKLSTHAQTLDFLTKRGN